MHNATTSFSNILKSQEPPTNLAGWITKLKEQLPPEWGNVPYPFIIPWQPTPLIIAPKGLRGIDADHVLIAKLPEYHSRTFVPIVD